MATRTAPVFGALVLTAALAAGCTAIPASSDPTTSTDPAAPDVAYQPLWPSPVGDAAWHADPAVTALKFTREYLGFTDIDRIIAVTEHVEEAWVRVGYPLPNDRSAPAATIHLARFGTAADAPWQVVGTLDDALTLTAPPYGSAAGSVIEAGGTITGVDESLRVQVRQAPDRLLGEYCCLPAGGEAQPWSATVEIAPPEPTSQPGVLTVVVSTGGHVTEVERFAVTGLRS